MVLTHSDFFCIFDQRLLFFLKGERKGLNFFIFRLMSYVNDPLLPLNSGKLFFTSNLVLIY